MRQFVGSGRVSPFSLPAVRGTAKSALRLVLLSALAAPAISGQDLLVTSWNTNSVIRYDGTTGALVGTFVASGSGGLSLPHSATFGPDGNLYVTSFGNDRVLRYDGQTGAFLDAFVPAGRGGLNGPSSADFGANGNLFVASFNTPAVMEYDGTTGTFVRRFIRPGNGLVVSESGHFGAGGDYYLANGGGDNVLRYDGTTGAFVEVFADGGGLQDPHEAVFGPNGNLYVPAFGSNRVVEYDGATGAFVRTFISSGNGLISPHGILFPGDGFAYVTSFGRDRVNRYDATTGAFDSAFVVPGLGGLDGAISLTRVPEPASATVYGCGVNPVGSLSVLAGEARIGTTLTLGVDNPLGTQPALSTPLLCVSLQPDPAFPCGTLRPNFGQAGPGAMGEFLLDFTSPNYLFQSSGGLWAGPGNPAPVPVVLPLDVRLVGREFFAQGAIFDSGGTSGIPFGLTDGLRFLIGL